MRRRSTKVARRRGLPFVLVKVECIGSNHIGKLGRCIGGETYNNISSIYRWK